MILSLGNVTSSPSAAKNTADENKGMSTFKKLLLFAGGAAAATTVLFYKHKIDIKRHLKGLEEQLSGGVKTTEEKISKELVENTVNKTKKAAKKKAQTSVFTKKHIQELLGYGEKDLEILTEKLKSLGEHIEIKGFNPSQMVLSHEKPLHSIFPKLKSGIADITLLQKYDIDTKTFKEILKINKADPVTRTA